MDNLLCPLKFRNGIDKSKYHTIKDDGVYDCQCEKEKCGWWSKRGKLTNNKTGQSMPLHKECALKMLAEK